MHCTSNAHMVDCEHKEVLHMTEEQKKFYLTMFETIINAKFRIDQCNYGLAHDSLTYMQYALSRFYIDAGGSPRDLDEILEV